MFANTHEAYFTYFEENWLKGFYQINLWNHWSNFKMLQENFKMTNNIVESFHYLVLHLNNYNHNPSLGSFLAGLSYIESRQLNDFNRYEDRILVKVKSFGIALKFF